VRSSLSNRGVRGLTLIELLVAMVLFAAVMSLVASALFQVSKASQVAQEQSNDFIERWNDAMLPAQWLQAIQVDPRSLQPLKGDAKLIETHVAAAGVWGAQSPQRRLIRVRLSLESDNAIRDETRLSAQIAADGQERPGMERVWTRAPGADAFVFRDTEGRETSQWPPVARADQDARRVGLPAAIGIRYVLPRAESRTDWIPIEVRLTERETGVGAMFGGSN
jgi:prepilin-type N-terminal cleavage/methylation domain-containing protein